MYVRKNINVMKSRQDQNVLLSPQQMTRLVVRMGFLWLLYLVSTVSSSRSSIGEEANDTHTPTLAPTPSHDHHHNDTSHTTNTPSLVPSSAKPYPTITPTIHHPKNVSTTAPTPTPVASSSPTVTPTSDHHHPPTIAPSVIPPPVITNSTLAPSSAPKPQPKDNTKTSIWRIIGKTLGWLILIALSVLLFGAIMSNRYQIYYFLVMTGRRICRMECTRWILQKTRLNRFVGGDYDATSGGGASLNEVIFDRGDMTEGLLMTGEE